MYIVGSTTILLIPDKNTPKRFHEQLHLKSTIRQLFQNLYGVFGYVMGTLLGQKDLWNISILLKFDIF